MVSTWIFIILLFSVFNVFERFYNNEENKWTKSWIPNSRKGTVEQQIETKKGKLINLETEITFVFFYFISVYQWNTMFIISEDSQIWPLANDCKKDSTGRRDTNSYQEKMELKFL